MRSSPIRLLDDIMIHNDAELIRSTLQGDEAAFGFLVDRYKGAVHALAYRNLGDFQIAEDITQEAFLQAYLKLSTLKQPERFSGWLYVITSNCCLAWQRRKRPRMFDGGEESHLRELSWKRHADAQVREEVRDALESLPESERTVLTLHYLAGMSYEEIAHFIGASRGAIRNRLHRARLHLREEMVATLQKAWGTFKLPSSMTQSLVEQIQHLGPINPSPPRPVAPWIAATVFVALALLASLGGLRPANFQPPYSFDGRESAFIVEITEAPILETPLKPERPLDDSSRVPMPTNGKMPDETEALGDGEGSTEDETVIVSENGHRFTRVYSDEKLDLLSHNMGFGFSPDGRFIFDVEGRIIPVEEGADPFELSAEFRDTRSMGACWSPDMTQLVIAPYGDLLVMPVSPETGRPTGPMRKLLEGSKDEIIRAPHWSPDSQRIAFPSLKGGDADIWVASVDGKELKQLTDAPENESVNCWSNLSAWSPDGEWIAYSRGNDLWMVPAIGGQPRQLVKDADEFAWSPDGQEFAFVPLDYSS